MPKKSTSISPTAHYTGQVWVRHGLSDERLATWWGYLFFHSMQPIMKLSENLGGPKLEHFLLARHQIIDALLEKAIESGEVTQVIECAAGLSPRGLRFAQKYGNKITYIEADLPDMATLKRAKLKKSLNEHHRVEAFNVLEEEGPLSLAVLAKSLKPKKRLVIITEGLINYFDRPTVEIIWEIFGKTLSQFSKGILLSDIHMKSTRHPGLVKVFMTGLSIFVKGRVFQHFKKDSEVKEVLKKSGFSKTTVHHPIDWSKQFPECAQTGADFVRVIEARV